MKHLLLLLLLLPFSGSSQAINGVKFADIPHQYASIIGESVPFKGKLLIYFDFGEAYGDYKAKITDVNGKAVEFTSTTDAINFMDQSGYELVGTVAIHNGGSAFFQYVMKRKPKAP